MASLKDQLKCFLHCGCAQPKYSACNTLNEQTLFTTARVQCITDRLKTTEIEAQEVLEVIEAVSVTGTSVIPQAALFALAVVVRKSCRCMIPKDDNGNPDYPCEKKPKVKGSKINGEDVEKEMKPDTESETDEPAVATPAGSKPWKRKEKIIKPWEELTEEEKKQRKAREEIKANAHSCHHVIRDAYIMARHIVERSNEIDDFLIFTHYLREIALSEKKRGFGVGWRRCIDRIYNRMNEMELAETLTRLNCTLKWSHKKVLRNHYPDLYYVPRETPGSVTTSDEIADAKDAVLLSLKLSFDKAQETYGSSNSATVRNVLSYLNKIRVVRTTKNDTEVVAAIKEHNLLVQQIPPVHLKSFRVWINLIPHIDPKYLFESINRLSVFKLFSYPVIVNAVVERIGQLQENAVHPTQAFVIRKRYEEAPLLALHFQFLQQNQKFKNQNPLNQMNKPPSKKPPPKRNQKIVDCLELAFKKSLKGLTATGKRYLIAVDTRATRSMTRDCACERFVRVQEAAALISLCIIKAEPVGMVRMVTWVSNAAVPIKPIDVYSPAESMESLLHKFSVDDGVAGNVPQLLKWACDKKEEFDVCIVLSDNTLEVKGKGAHETVRDQLERYQKMMKKDVEDQTRAKLVTCCLVGEHKNYVDLIHRNMLLICGFDIRVSPLIENFSLGRF